MCSPSYHNILINNVIIRLAPSYSGFCLLTMAWGVREFKDVNDDIRKFVCQDNYDINTTLPKSTHINCKNKFKQKQRIQWLINLLLFRFILNRLNGLRKGIYDMHKQKHESLQDTLKRIVWKKSSFIFVATCLTTSIDDSS